MPCGWTTALRTGRSCESITTPRTTRLGSATASRGLSTTDRKSTRLNSSHLVNLVCRLLLEKKKKLHPLNARAPDASPSCVPCCANPRRPPCRPRTRPETPDTHHPHPAVTPRSPGPSDTH